MPGRSPNIAVASNVPLITGKFVLGKKAFILIANLVGFVTLGLVGASIGIGSTQSNYKSFNYTCNVDSDCRIGYLCQNNVCACRTTQYYNGTSCINKLSIYSRCSKEEECGLDMICLNKNGSSLCQCASDRFWNGSSCEPRLTFNDICFNFNYPSDACDPSVGLSCVITTCQCNATSAWDGNSCNQIQSFGGNCTFNMHCDSTKSLQCSGAGMCTCASTQYWSGSTCINKLSFNGACSNTGQCLESLDLSCQSGLCRCNATCYWTGSTCAQNRINGQWCSGSVPCDTSLGLSCQSSTCLCSTNFYWDGAKCVNQLSIGSLCNANQNCLQSLGLSCTSSFCSCAFTHFWSGSSCVTKYVDGVGCLSSVQCQTHNGLSCTGGTCQCSSTHFWSGSSCIAKYGNWVSCTSTNQCQTWLGLTCRWTRCTCNTPQYWAGSGCQNLPQPPWVFNAASNLFYAVRLTSTDHHSAQAWCNQFSGNLFTIQTSADLSLLQFVYSNNFGQNFYVGAYAAVGMNFYWLSTGVSVPGQYWCPGEPNCGQPCEPCTVAGWCSAFQFNDIPCSYQAPFLCERR